MRISKQQAIDLGILALRWYLAFYMFSYGFSKITQGQFQVHDPAILKTPLEDAGRFYIAWYLFGLSPVFSWVVGLTQMLGAVLIVFHRTTLIGALVLLPVIGQIFLIDVAFTMEQFGPALPARLAGMLVSDLLILWYYKTPVVAAWKVLTTGISTRFGYAWWVYPLLPVVGFLMDFVWAVLSRPLRLL